MGFKRINRRSGYSSKIFELEFRDYEDDKGLIHKDLAVIKSKGAANVVAITDDQKVVLVRQYRFGIEDYTLEIPGGLLEPAEDKLVAVKRELLEETGYMAREWQFLGSVYSNPVFIDSEIHHFLAFSASQQTTQDLDFDEEIEIVQMPVRDVIEKLTAGEFKHPHTVTALQLARPFLDKL